MSHKLRSSSKSRLTSKSESIQTTQPLPELDLSDGPDDTQGLTPLLTSSSPSIKKQFESVSVLLSADNTPHVIQTTNIDRLDKNGNSTGINKVKVVNDAACMNNLVSTACDLTSTLKNLQKHPNQHSNPAFCTEQNREDITSVESDLHNNSNGKNSFILTTSEQPTKLHNNKQMMSIPPDAEESGNSTDKLDTTTLESVARHQIQNCNASATIKASGSGGTRPSAESSVMQSEENVVLESAHASCDSVDICLDHEGSNGVTIFPAGAKGSSPTTITVTYNVTAPTTSATSTIITTTVAAAASAVTVPSECKHEEDTPQTSKTGKIICSPVLPLLPIFCI